MVNNGEKWELSGIDIVKDAPVNIVGDNGKTLHTLTVPFSMKRSASLVTCPDFKIGGTYTVKTDGYEKTFTLSEPFMPVK